MLLLKTLFSFLTKAERRFFLFLLSMMLLAALIELAGIGSLYPYIKLLENKHLIHHQVWLSQAYQWLAFKSENHFLVFAGAVIFLLLVLKSLLSLLNNYFQSKFVYQMNIRLSRYCLNSFMNMPYVDVINKNSSVLSKHLLLDVSSVSTIIQSILTIMTDVVIATTLLGLMLAMDPLLILCVVVALSGLAVLVNRFLKPQIDQLSIANERCNRFAYQTATEALSSIKEAKIYRTADYFVQRYLKWQSQIAKQMTKFSLFSAVPSNLLNVMGFGVLLIALLYLVITHGHLMAVLPIIGVLAVSVQRLLPSAARVSTSVSNIRRYQPLVYIVREALDFFSDRVSDSVLSCKISNHKPMMFDRVLELKEITYRYPGCALCALDKVSFSIQKPSIVGIVGESGSGKSTLIDVLLGFLPFQSGRFFCDGRDVLPEQCRDLSSMMAYVPQQVVLLDASIQENIAFGVEAQLIDYQALENAIAIAQLKTFIEEQPQGLSTPVGERGVKISGGQRQRIGIARALYRCPEVLILDEATNALDAATEKHLNEALMEFMKKKTLIIVAHRLSSVALCHQIIQLEKGRVIECGDFETLSQQSSAFRRIYDLSGASV